MSTTLNEATEMQLIAELYQRSIDNGMDKDVASDYAIDILCGPFGFSNPDDLDARGDEVGGGALQTLMEIVTFRLPESIPGL